MSYLRSLETKADTSAIALDSQLIKKYDVKAPRYTSYPSAAEFTDHYGPEQFKQFLSEIKSHSFEPLSLYIHIPFCRDICYYCGCNKIVTRDVSQADRYLDYIEKEIALLHQHIGRRRTVTQLHFGGGTPSFLSSAQLTRLIHMISRYFKLSSSEQREYSLEIDPRTIDRSYLALLAGLGFNRISLGIQDFDYDVQKAVNRVTPTEQVIDLVNAARDFNYDSINFDLIYGLPLQTTETLRATLEQTIALSPDRIACYNYAHLPERFSSQRAIERQTLPSPDQKLAMLQQISEQLCAAGYVHIGMDHFVKPDDALAIAQSEGKLQRNFQGYSVCKSNDTLGIGVSAISSGTKHFSQNAKNIEDYYAALDANELATEKGLIADSDDLARRDAIMPLIANLHLDIGQWEKNHRLSFSSYFSNEIKMLESFENDNLIIWEDKSLRIAEKGRPLIRNICAVFDKNQLNGNKNTQYSRVI